MIRAWIWLRIRRNAAAPATAGSSKGLDHGGHELAEGNPRHHRGRHPERQVTLEKREALWICDFGFTIYEFRHGLNEFPLLTLCSNRFRNICHLASQPELPNW